VPRTDAFGGRDELIRFFFHTGRKYCHNGGMGFAPNQLAASARPGGQ
jgi:hypothetical protein